MSKFTFGVTSLNNLKGVHPDLVFLAMHAIKTTKIDFGISCGVRTLEEQRKLMQEGKSKTLNSLHLMQDDGYAHAIDIFPFINGKANWRPSAFKPIMQEFINHAIDNGIPIELGGLWSSFFDYPHIQLRKEYRNG